MKKVAKNNITFYGAMDNNLLQKYYQSNDVSILPSSSEPWGLVVEEALNNGLPVIVSDKVGCGEELINKSNGIIFKLSKTDGLKNAITTIQSVAYYNNLRENISKLDFNKIADEQVRCYL